MVFTIQNLKDAFSPKNIKVRMSNNPNYIEDTMKKFFNDNQEFVGQTLTEITKPVNSGMKNRFMAIEKVINNQPNALEELSGLVGQNLRGSAEPKMSESKKLSGRKTKGKVIEKGKGVVRRMDFTSKVEEEEKESEVIPNQPTETVDIPVVYPPKEDFDYNVLPPPPNTPIEENIPIGEEVDLDNLPIGEEVDLDEPIPLEPVADQEPAVTQEIKKSVSTVEQPSFGSTKDSIPKKRLISDGKSATQLYNDILYFRKNFPNETKNIEFDSRNRNPEYLLRKHKEYVSKLKPEGAGDKKVGVIITASEYIKDKLKEIILENSINGLTAKDLVIDIEGETEKSEDIQSYEFKTGANGMPFAKKEPIYKYIPETNPSQTQSTIGRIPNPVTKYRGLEVTAKNLVRQDPFVKPRKTIRLKYSY